MKKTLSIFAVIALMLMTASCDDSNSKKSAVTRTVKLLNHIYNPNINTPAWAALSNIDYTFDEENMKMSLVVRAKLNGNQEETFKFTDLDMTEKKGVYSFSGTASGIKDMRGNLNTNEQTLRVNYTTDDGFRVIATSTDIFSTSCATTILYKDNQSDNKQSPIYQISIDPESMTAQIMMLDFLDKSATRTVRSVKSNVGTKVEVTPMGYAIEADEIKTTAIYLINGQPTTTTTYPFADLKMTFDLENDKFEGEMLVGNLQVNANGAIGN